ncbi:MAG: discoidin domain-containing protein [Verrucomicrobiales bacterium]
MALLPVSTVSGLANQGAKLSASAVFKELPEYAAGMAADGDPSTRWATPAGTKEAWLEIDLGAEKSFRSMEIDEATAIDKGMRARVLGFQIEIKDGNQWKPIYHGKGIGEHKICPFPSAIRARFFRIRITDATDGPTLQEVRLLE